jgi:hypothetical protein
MQLVRYHLSTGVLAGIYEANTEVLLTVQIVPEDPTWGFLFPEDEIPVDQQDRWEVIDSLLTAKQEVRISAIPASFAANGVATCQITVEPLVDCTLLLNAEAVDITTGDPNVLLTADSPQQFVITLQPMMGYWATPVTVVAT